MLFQGYPTLFGVNFAGYFTHAKLYVQIGYPLIQYIALQTSFDLVVPDMFWIYMQVFLKTSGYDYPARELGAKFSRYS